MTRVSLTECYDDRSVISKLKRIEDKVDQSTVSAEASAQAARRSADAAQHTADTFSGAVGSVVGEAQREIAQAKAEVTEAKTEVDSVVEDVASAVQTANSASASAQASAQTVQTYEDRLQRAEVDIQTLDGETADLYAKDGENVKLSPSGVQTMSGSHTAVTMVKTNTYGTIGAGTLIQKMADEDMSSPVAGYYNMLHVEDRNGVPVISDRLHIQNTGAWEIVRNYRLPNGNVTRLGTVSVDVNGGYVMGVTTPPADAGSGAIVNKAYVEATDGTTNNLVHRTANENIGGIKTFTEAVNHTVSLGIGTIPAAEQVKSSDTVYDTNGRLIYRREWGNTTSGWLYFRENWYNYRADAEGVTHTYRYRKTTFFESETHYYEEIRSYLDGTQKSAVRLWEVQV